MSNDGRRFAEVLARVSRAMKSAAGETMRSQGLHVGQNFILEQLWQEDSLTPGELARRIGVETPTVTRAAQRLETAGLVRRVRDQTDARLVRVQLTDRGRALEQELPRRLDRVYQRALRGMSPEERATLLHLLTRVADSMNEGAGPPEEPAS